MYLFFFNKYENNPLCPLLISKRSNNFLKRELFNYSVNFTQVYLYLRLKKNNDSSNKTSLACYFSIFNFHTIFEEP